MGVPKSSILVSTANRAEQLKRFLGHLPANTLRREAVELVIVDNASVDDSYAMLLEFQRSAEFPVKILQEPIPGKGRALNGALSSCVGDFIVLTDDDCYFADNYFQILDRVFADPTIAYCGGRVVLFDESDSRIACIYSTRRRVFPVNTFLSSGTVQGCNLVVRRSVMEEVGGYDPIIGPGTPFRADDLDLVARISVAGYRGLYEPDLVVFHHHGRKPGKEEKALKRANDHSLGGHYAKLIREGHFIYLFGWLGRAIVPWRIHRTWREIRGAFHFLRYVKESEGKPASGRRPGSLRDES